MDTILQREIENHLASFPERHKDVSEMRREWNEYKSKTLWVLLGFVGSILAIGVWVGTIQTNIQHITEVANKASTQADETVKRINALEVTNGEIRTRLSGIETTLEEIKIAIRQLRY